MKKVAILQSNYIPWKGYFDLIGSVDEFIIYDEVQYTKNDWRNRNLIKTPTGCKWLTVPVGQKINRKINEVIITDHSWQNIHWQSIASNYKTSPFFVEISNLLMPLYLNMKFTSLSQLNMCFIECILEYLKIKTVISNSLDYKTCAGKNEKLIDLCLQSNAEIYISGPNAKSYLNVDLFHENCLQVEWFDYSLYPKYPQLWEGFTHEVSIIDLLFNCGQEAINFMKSDQNGNT